MSTQTTRRLPVLPVADPVTLSAHLSQHNLPGQRSAPAIRELRAARAQLAAPRPARPPVAERVRAWLFDRAEDEILRRNGDNRIVGQYGTTWLEITDRQEGMVLLHAEGWRSYGKRQPARLARLSYLWGPDDAGAGPWAVRVAGTVTTVAEALTWLTPAEVAAAEAKGRRVRRQGDVYAVETTRAHDGRGLDLLPDSHEWRASTRYLLHRPADGRRHRALRLPWPVRFVPQTAYEMGRTNTRTNAD
ncbi:hypothetical protein OG723_44375 (plasmid) [Streptomyces sp. NBC_01278]|uniref:hypothetical protein n=1 Tax=Streptomyces sp. NBC_01278 TaxID=2903809 RepID=UPI002E352673|nr:hypothetical protein [Streptomyces sp. NBC_01278]